MEVFCWAGEVNSDQLSSIVKWDIAGMMGGWSEFLSLPASSK